MKHRAFWFLTLFLGLHSPETSFAESAYGYKLFTQDHYDGWKINENGETLKSDGCCLFSFVHALQFAKRTNYNDTTLDELWQTYRRPSDTVSALKNYTSYAEKNLGVSFKKNSKGSKELGTTQDQDLRNLFIDGYSLVVNNLTGHVLCAVDYAVCDSNGIIINDDGKTIPGGGAMYIHVADSSPASSTFYPGRAYHDNVYSVSHGKMFKKGNYSYGTGNAAAAYWTKVNSLYVLRAIKGNWSGHSSLPG